MKYFVFSLMVIIAVSSCASLSPSFTVSAKGEIEKTLKDQQNAWNSGDIAGFMQGYWKSDSLVFIGSKGLTYGWNATLENYKRSYPTSQEMGKLTFTIVTTEILSKTSARMIGKYSLKRKNDLPSGYFTLIWKNIDGKWLIVSDQTCG